MSKIDPNPIRWIELGLPHPSDPDRLIFLQADGPFALRKWYQHPEGDGEYQLHLDQRTEAGGLTGCLHCGHPELYSAKRFPKALGIGIVVGASVLTLILVGTGASPLVAYSPLLAAALADFIIFQVASEQLACYACGSVHRGFRNDPRHPAFDRTIAERLTYGDQAVMGSPMRESGTANAPDPEH